MSWSPPPPRPSHPYYMHDAIYAQPGALRLVLRRNAGAVKAAAARLASMEQTFLSGIGTSWHACLAGELLLSRIGRLGHRVRAFHSFEFKNYWPEPGEKTGMITVSHRGTKRFSLEALEKAKAAGGVGIAITGLGSGEGLKIADHTLTTVEQESSGAHTASYTAALALLVGLAAELGGDEEALEALEGIPDQMAVLLGQESWEQIAARFRDRGKYCFVGGGPNTATAYEGALKMNEANYSTTIGMNCEQFLHGPWAAVGAGDMVWLIAPSGPSYERCLAVAKAAREIGAPVVGIVEEGDGEISRLCVETISIPPIPELLTPILAVVPLQLFTYHLALLRGANPDTMRTHEPAYQRARAAFSL